MAELRGILSKLSGSAGQFTFKRVNGHISMLIGKARKLAVGHKAVGTVMSKISVGYCVNSIRATQFRQWCTYVIRQFSLRGYIIDKKRMENGSFIGEEYFYKEYVCVHLQHLFARVVSYNRFVELQKTVAIPLAIFIKKVFLGKCTGISLVDSTPLRVCRNQKILNLVLIRRTHVIFMLSNA